MTAGRPSQISTGTQVDHFRVERQLGKGGMGTVFLAEDVNLGRTVALKVLSPALLEEEGYRERFYREARHAARLNHPNIVSIFHLGETAGTPYFAMEFVEGTPLDEVLRAQGPLEPAQAVRLLLQVVEGAEHALGHGIIHRDLKPANLVAGSDGRIRILDFGLARASDSTGLTRSGAIMGTPDYMAPEQGLGKTVTMTADVYALGVILFQFLTGQLPFHGDSALEVMMAHVQEPPPDLARLCPALPASLCEVIACCLAKAPEERFQDYPSLRASLQACLPELTGIPAQTPSPRGSASSSAATRAVTPRPPEAGATVSSHPPSSGGTPGRTLTPDRAAPMAPSPVEASGTPAAPASTGSPWPWTRWTLAPPEAAYPPLEGNPLRYLLAYWANPLQAPRQLARRCPEPTLAEVGRQLRWLALPLVFPNFFLEGPQVLGGLFLVVVLIAVVLVPASWLVSRIRGSRMTCPLLFLLWVWVATTGSLANLPVLGGLAKLMGLAHLLGLPYILLTTSSPLPASPSENGQLPV